MKNWNIAVGLTLFFGAVSAWAGPFEGSRLSVSQSCEGTPFSLASGAESIGIRNSTNGVADIIGSGNLENRWYSLDGTGAQMFAENGAVSLKLADGQILNLGQLQAVAICGPMGSAANEIVINPGLAISETGSRGPCLKEPTFFGGSKFFQTVQSTLSLSDGDAKIDLTEEHKVGCRGERN